MSLAVKPVCYIRAIRNDDEIVYISNNVDFIKRVIQKYNEKSKIIFVAPKNINIPANFPFKIYQLSIYGYIGNLRSGLREIFDGSPEIIRYFSAHYDSGKRKKNIAVDQLQEENHYKTLTKREIEENALKEIHRVQEESFDFIRLPKSARRMPDVRVRNTMFVAICDFSKINMPEAIDIYGASWIGKFFYDKVSQLTRIDCFIDRRPPDRNPQYNGTPIISIDEYSNPNRNLIVVVPTYDYYEIVNNIREQLGDRDVPCVRIDEFLKNGIPYEKRRELGL